nr:muscarinic acetylcholine receptor M4-like [Lytechinus pictus]
MSGLVGTTVASEILTDVVTLVTLAGDGEDIVLSSPYSPDVVIVLSLVIAVIIFMTVVGNLFVVIAFCTTTKLRTYNNYFILGLAIADLLVGAVDMPLFAVVIIMGRWPFSAVFCDIFTFLDHAFTHTSMVLVTLISLDRCVAVSDPFRHRQHWRRRSRAILIIAIGYILPFIVWLPATTLWQIINGNDQRPFPEDVCEPLYFQSVIASFALPIVYFFVPFILTTALCAKIYAVIRKFYKGREKMRLATGIAQSPSSAVDRPSDPGTGNITGPVQTSAATESVVVKEDVKKTKEIGSESMKGVRTLSFIVTAMWIAWFPAVIVTVTSPFCPTCVPSIVYSVVIFWGYMNSMINPICYALADEAFKDSFMKILTLRCLKTDTMTPSI